jgi:hypothetical protein
MDLVSRVTPGPYGERNCTRDGGGPFGFGNQVPISSHRKLLSSKAMVVNVAETSGYDLGRYGSSFALLAKKKGSVPAPLGRPEGLMWLEDPASTNEGASTQGI